MDVKSRLAANVYHNNYCYISHPECYEIRLRRVSVYFGFNLTAAYWQECFSDLRKYQVTEYEQEQTLTLSNKGDVFMNRAVMEFCQTCDKLLSIQTNKLTVISWMSINYSSKHHLVWKSVKRERNYLNDGRGYFEMITFQY